MPESLSGKIERLMEEVCGGLEAFADAMQFPQDRLDARGLMHDQINLRDHFQRLVKRAASPARLLASESNAEKTDVPVSPALPESDTTGSSA